MGVQWGRVGNALVRDQDRPLREQLNSLTRRYRGAILTAYPSD